MRVFNGINPDEIKKVLPNNNNKMKIEVSCQDFFIFTIMTEPVVDGDLSNAEIFWRALKTSMIKAGIPAVIKSNCNVSFSLKVLTIYPQTQTIV